MSLASTITTFLIDVSPSMGDMREITEDVELELKDGEDADAEDAARRQAAIDGMDGELNQGAEGESGTPGWRTRTRKTSKLEWACDFVGRRVQTYVHANLKTGKVHLMTYGSPRTRNVLSEQRGGKIAEAFEGIDELFQPAQPTLLTCELVRALRASKAEENPHAADPLSALIAAINTLTDKDRGGLNSSSKNTWTRTIYLVTDALTPFKREDVETIQQKMCEENIQLKIIGIDFDDEEYGFKEEEKNPVKAKNEAFWHGFLHEVPGSGIATAADVIDQIKAPQLAPKKPAAMNTTLTFGDPSQQHASFEVLGIQVCMYKATALVRPMSAKKLSKLAQQSAGGQRDLANIAQTRIVEGCMPEVTAVPDEDDDGDQIAAADRARIAMSYAVEMARKHFILDEIKRLEADEIASAKPLPEDTEFVKAWRLGKSHIPVEHVQDIIYGTEAGLEIIQFHALDKLRRWMIMGETSYVLAPVNNAEAQLRLSSMIRAMHELGKFALVRHVKKKDGDPKLGVLVPVVKDAEAGIDLEHLVYGEVPFADDFRQLVFPPLEYVVDRNGVEHREHRLLPSQDQQKAMDELVDAMDLTDAYENVDGSRAEWFSTEDSFNPAIHRIKEAVEWRVFHPEDTELPRSHWELDKFLKRPEIMWGRAEPLVERCRELFELEYSPDAALKRQELFKENKRRRDAAAASGDVENKTIVLQDEPGDSDSDGGGHEGRPVKTAKTQPAAVATLGATQAYKPSGDDSETEDEDGDYVKISRPDPKLSQPDAAVATQEPSPSPALDTGGIVISSGTPVEDFASAMKDAADPAQVIRAMCHRIRDIIASSMSYNSYPKARDAMRVCRAAAAEEDEAEEWNSFIRKLKRDLQSNTFGRRSRRDFWDSFVRGTQLGLITRDEDAGNRSEVTSKMAADFINL